MPFPVWAALLTHWGRVTHICVSKLTITGSANGLSPGRRQAIIWNNAGILLIGPLGRNFNEILIEIHTISCKKIHLKMSSGKCRPSCLGLNVLTMDITVLIPETTSELSSWLQLPECTNGLVQDSGNSSVLAVDLPQSGAKPLWRFSHIFCHKYPSQIFPPWIPYQWKHQWSSST